MAVKIFRVAMLAVALLFIAGGAVFLWLGKRQPPVQATTAGTYELLEVTPRGQPLRKGSPLEVLLQRFLPPGGVEVFGTSLRRPVELAQHDDAALVAWMMYRGPLKRHPMGSHLFGARVVAESPSGRQFENPLPSIRWSRSNETVISVPLHAFPRDSDEIRLRFSPSATNEAAREWISFNIKNPLRARAADWRAEPLPRTNVVAGETVVLKSLSLNPVMCDFQLPGAGWTISHCTIEDPEGNVFHCTGTRWRTNRPAEISKVFTWALETNHPWRVKARFVNTDHVSPLGPSLVFGAQGQSFLLTNKLGQVSTCEFHGTSINIAGREGDGPPLWIIVGATNVDTGRPLRFFAGEFWSGLTGGSMRKLWPVEDDAAKVAIQLADPESFVAEWIVDPAGAPRTRAWVDLNPPRGPLPPPLK